MQSRSTGLREIADETTLRPSKARLYRHLADTVMRFIEVERLTQGARLPPLDCMAKDLGVSRLSIREVLIALEARNIVQMVRGVGTLVGPAGGNLDQTGQEQVTSLFEARRLLEGQVVTDAVRNAGAAGLAGLTASLEMLERSAAADISENLRSFHVEIGQLTGNHAIRAVVAGLWPDKLDVSGRARVAREVASANAAAWIEAHGRIHDAVMQTDSEGALKAMNDFGDRALSDLFGWLERRDLDRVQQRLDRHRKTFSRRVAPMESGEEQPFGPRSNRDQDTSLFVRLSTA